jgi:2-hydroxy-3-oxopropionate reductase
MVEALTVEAVAEALTLARRLGADASRVRAALAGGFAASRILDVQGTRMLSRDFATIAPASVYADALGRMVDEAHALGLDLPGTALVAQQVNALVGAGEGGLDSSALVCVLERMAGERR